jgi:hypothetical protein
MKEYGTKNVSIKYLIRAFIHILKGQSTLHTKISLASGKIGFAKFEVLSS